MTPYLPRKLVHRCCRSYLYKKGDRDNPANYRGITHPCAMSKLLTFILNRRINEWAEKSNILSQTQFAYNPGYSTTDAILVLYAVLSSSLESFNRACCGFINYTEAFDKINRDILFKRLKQCHVSAKLLNMIKTMYSKLKCQVRTSVGVSFARDNGVMQG